MPKNVSEDCLNLNVFVPVNSSGPLPVMVFFHGGSFDEGSNQGLSGFICHFCLGRWTVAQVFVVWRWLVIVLFGVGRVSGAGVHGSKG